MADEESHFLARWARRKDEAKRAAVEPDTEATADATAAGEPAAVEEEELFDPASVPGLEELTGETDMTVFMRKCVPQDIRNAALRRAYALDASIRDYVSPNLEYAFDWNVPGGVPGSGDLAPGYDTAGAVARMFSTQPGKPGEEATKPEPQIAQASEDSQKSDTPSDAEIAAVQHGETVQQPMLAEAENAGIPSVRLSAPKTLEAAAPKPDARDAVNLRSRRSHGGAMPS